MQLIINQGTKGIARSIVYKLIVAIILLAQVAFIISYITGRNISTFVPRVAITGPVEPRFMFLIHGTFGDGQLVKPMAVTTANDKIYVSDTGNKRVQVFDMDGQFLFNFGKVGRNQGEFHFPYGIAGDKEGKIYVADLYLGRVSVFTPEGEFIQYFGNEEARKAMDGPGDLFITEDNRLFVTDINKSKVMAFDVASGALLQEFGEHGREVGQLYAPNGVTVDRQGLIWVADTGNQRVQVFDQTGSFLKVVNGTPDGKGDSVLSNPRGIGIRGSSVFVVSNLTHTIYAFNQKGEEEFQLGGLGSLNTQFNFPNGLHVDENGRIYITDTTNQRVAVYR